MASFVIHHVAGVKFLEVLENEYNINLTNEEKNKFLMGNLIVDSVKTEVNIPSELSEEEQKELRRKFSKITQEEKRLTHFRNEKDSELVVQVPFVENFVEKYKCLFYDITLLGYLFHLYTDKMFFEYLFDESFEFLDKDNNLTKYIKNISFVRVKKNNQIHNLRDFFDHRYIYSIYKDYTTINKILLEYYGINFDSSCLLESVNEFVNPGIEEVDYSKIVGIINKTNSFINESYKCEQNDLNIFDYEVIKNFINVVFNRFIDEYGSLFLSDVKVRKLNNGGDFYSGKY